MTYSRNFDKTFHGIKYRLGNENHEELEDITISLEGELKRNIIGHSQFIGEIWLGDILILSEDSNLEAVTLILEEEYGTLLPSFYYFWLGYHFNTESSSHYCVEPTEPIKSKSYGEIYFDKKFNSLTITIYEPFESDRQSWSSGDRLMISAPAKNRHEALQISNKLLKHRLNYYGKYNWLE